MPNTLQIEYHVCKRCHRIIRRSRIRDFFWLPDRLRTYWAHMNSKEFRLCGDVAEPDFPE